MSGSTVVGIYKKRKTIYFANAGDSRGIVIGQTTGRLNDEQHGGDGTQDIQIMILA